MNRAVPLSLALVASLSAACVAAPETESEEGLESAPGKELVVTITEELGWPGTASVSGDMEVTYQDDQKLELSAPIHVVPTDAPFQIAVDQGWGQWVSTSMAFVLYHRQRGSGAEWKPVGYLGYGGSYGTAVVSQSKDGVFLIWDKVKVKDRRFTGFNPILHDAAFFEFEGCNVMESDPELGIVVLPMSNWWNMADDYSYSLSVSCLDEAGKTTICPAYGAESEAAY